MLDAAVMLAAMTAATSNPLSAPSFDAAIAVSVVAVSAPPAVKTPLAIVSPLRESRAWRIFATRLFSRFSQRHVASAVRRLTVSSVLPSTNNAAIGEMRSYSVAVLYGLIDALAGTGEIL